MSQDHHNSSLGCLIRSIGEARLASCSRRSVLRRRARKGHVLVQNAIKSRRFEELCPEAKPASFLRWTKSRRMLLRDYGESVQWMFPSTSMPVCNKSPDQERLAAREKALHEAKISLTKVCRWDAWISPRPPHLTRTAAEDPSTNAPGEPQAAAATKECISAQLFHRWRACFCLALPDRASRARRPWPS